MAKRRPIMTAILALVSLHGVQAMAGTARFERFSYEGKSQEQVTLGAGEYRNPILSGYYPDPSIVRVGDDYYLVNSSFTHFPGIPIFKSKDMVNWVQIGNAIDRPGQLDFTGLTVSRGVFAPDISWHDGLFYIVNTCVDCKGNFVITAKDPAGPWSDPIWLPFDGIDPSLYWEGDRAYIVNNRGPDEKPRYEGHRAIWVQEYDWRAGKMVGDSTQLINGGVDIAKKPVWIEGPHLFKKDGYYYLTAAEGGTSVNHSQVVFRSKSLRGPFLPYSGNPILTQRDLDPARPHPIGSAGHAKLIQTQDGDWWATFLAVRPYKDDFYNTGRETFLLPVEWRNGWPHILEAGKPIPFAHSRPALPAGRAPELPLTGDFSYIDEFNGDALSMQWVGIRTPKQPFYSVTRGALELGSGAPLGDLGGTPAFIGRRQQHAIATISTILRYTPTVDGDRAGLAAVQNDNSLLFFGLTRIDGEERIALYTRDRSATDKLVASAPFSGSGPILLTISDHGGSMRFNYTAAGQKQTLIDNLDPTLLSTERAGGFVGTVIGPYHYTPTR